MTEEQKQPRSAVERQRLYKERQREAGFRLTALWIHEETEQEGRQAATESHLSRRGAKTPSVGRSGG